MGNRNYTAATIAEMRRVALDVELRRRIAVWREGGAQLLIGTDKQFESGFMTALMLVNLCLDELAPVCDNPPEAATLADYTDGMAE